VTQGVGPEFFWWDRGLNSASGLHGFNADLPSEPHLLKSRDYTGRIGIGKDCLNRIPAPQQLKDGQMGLHEIKKLLHNKRNGL
jgi:hypothetical protein